MAKLKYVVYRIRKTPGFEGSKQRFEFDDVLKAEAMCKAIKKQGFECEIDFVVDGLPMFTLDY